MIRALLLRLFGLEKLQKAHDLRAVLNSRLSAENQRLRKELNRNAWRKKPKPQKEKSAENKALAHINSQRQNILTDRLRAKVTEAEFAAECEAVNALTDEQVMAYRKPSFRDR